MIEHNNVQLNKIMSRGISENHFHLFASTPYFNLAWLSLMNKVEHLQFKQAMHQMDIEMRNPWVVYEQPYNRLTFAEIHMQAVLIRLYLFSVLTGQRIILRKYVVPWSRLWKIVYERENVGDVLLTVSSKEIKDKEQYLEIKCPMFCNLYHEARKALNGREDSLNYCEKETLVEMILQMDEREKERFLERLLCDEEYTYQLSLEECHWIFGEAEERIFEEEWKRQTEDAVMYYLRNPDILSRNKKKIQRIIDGFLNINSSNQKDYAIPLFENRTEQKEELEIMCGERWFLYTMMRRRWEKRESINDTCYNLFYAYLCIKETFRKELILSNDRIGFRNFQQYQKRKSWFTPTYTEGELARLAVWNSFYRQPIQSLEIRVMPENTCRENVQKIERYNEEIKKLQYNEQCYYVFHFRKKADVIERGSLIMPIKYRHYALRKTMKQQTYAIMHVREKYPETAKCLLGIDACSQEDGCRPEVFAIAFRTLQNHVAYSKKSGDILFKLPKMIATYHVGEVFSDILDGLRAIDEAIRFLNLGYGSRIGHANALGLDVLTWYKERDYKITIRKQDYLDNIVWLYHRIIRYRIHHEDGLVEYLERKFQFYFKEIYRKVLDTKYMENIWKEACEYDEKNYGQTGRQGAIEFEFNIHTYYYSWMLRGDDPELYSSGYYKKPLHTIDLWDFCSVNKIYPREKKKRYMIESSILYHYYHYHELVREYGNEIISVELPKDIVQVIFEVQKELQEEIASREIAIETNPSSNVMISTFKTYDKHPIIQFYNKGLTYDPDKIDACPQINVSINTDDQEVFSTCLTNEYALMVDALSRKKDQNGKLVYKKSMIYEWINNIRQMGNEQSLLYYERDIEDRM